MTAQNGPQSKRGENIRPRPRNAQGGPIPPAWRNVSRYLRAQWRRLRNVATIETLAATNAQLLAQLATVTAANVELRQQLGAATHRAESLELSLGMARAIAAVAIRERDRLDGALDRTCRELARHKRRQRQDSTNARYWITRCTARETARNVASN